MLMVPVKPKGPPRAPFESSECSSLVSMNGGSSG
jgi:hypothetical protein